MSQNKESVKAKSLHPTVSSNGGLGIDVMTEDGQITFLSLASLAALLVPPLRPPSSKSASSVSSERSLLGTPDDAGSQPSSRESSEPPSRSDEQNRPHRLSSVSRHRRESVEGFHPYYLSLPSTQRAIHPPPHTNRPLTAFPQSSYYSHSRDINPYSTTNHENIPRYSEQDRLPFPSMRRGRPLGNLHAQDVIQERHPPRTMVVDDREPPVEDQDRLQGSSGGRTVLQTLVSTVPLEFVWAPRLGRCISPESVMARSEETLVVVLLAGEWVHVYEGNMEVYPWTANGNSWIKGQVKGKQHCICGFAFHKGGQERDMFKRPSVIREHLANCHRLAPDDKLAQICRFTRQADKALRTSRTRRMQSQGEVAPAPGRR